MQKIVFVILPLSLLIRGSILLLPVNAVSWTSKYLAVCTFTQCLQSPEHFHAHSFEFA